MSLKKKASKLAIEGRKVSSSEKLSTKTAIMFDGEIMLAPLSPQTGCHHYSIQHGTSNSDQSNYTRKRKQNR